eukprot:3458378-Prymnesium_polylepis.1
MVHRPATAAAGARATVSDAPTAAAAMPPLARARPSTAPLCSRSCTGWNRHQARHFNGTAYRSTAELSRSRAQPRRDLGASSERCSVLPASGSARRPHHWVIQIT